MYTKKDETSILDLVSKIIIGMLSPEPRMFDGSNMRAIDLYAGIGGWGLGLRLAGVEIVESYEIWKPAIATHNGNLGGDVEPVDIRELKLGDLPTDIELVVGSPPCTEFSYSNRGGSGNITEGLKDLVKFFEIVQHLKPRFWAMENVPRVADVLRRGFETPSHPLYRFRKLNPTIEVIDFSDYGTPQARKRCIATNISLECVAAFREKLGKPTLGDVVEALNAKKRINDPVWGIALSSDAVSERETEPPLNAEELRMNSDAKTFHPVYNNMAFPDPMGQPARTVTATCTRVSRESIIVEDLEAGGFRRLSIRERACLQGFPITYQFFARSFAEKAKMIGNAIPPTFTYLLALAAKGVTPSAFKGLNAASSQLHLPAGHALATRPDGEGRTYPMSRGFRAAIPGLRFKSGMRFELSNSFTTEATEWRIRFFFGQSKDIREIDLSGDVTRDLRQNDLFAELLRSFQGELTRAAQKMAASDPSILQLVWARKSGGIGPYEVVDHIGELAALLVERLSAVIGSHHDAVVEYVLAVAADSPHGAKPSGTVKLSRNALAILAGFIVGDWFNTLDWHNEKRIAA
jgi:DNA (cytosine-5)-methyltransferase 1